MSRFLKTKVAIACDVREDSKWAIGDALLEEIGPPSERGVSDGSSQLMRELMVELEDDDLANYSTMALSNMRQVAYAFPEETRVYKLPWSCYREAGTLKMMKKIKTKADKARVNRITVSYIIQTKREIEKEEHIPTKAEVNMAITAFVTYLAEVRLKIRKMREDLPRDYMDHDNFLEESEALMEAGNELVAHGNEARGVAKPQLTVIGGHNV